MISFKSSAFKISILFTTLILLSCKDDPEFVFEINDLTNTQWGIPQMIRPPQDMTLPDLDAPTIFYPEGYVTIGPARTDFWTIRSSRSILLEQSGEIWFFIDLTPVKMHVEKTKQNDGTLLGEYVYYPME